MALEFKDKETNREIIEKERKDNSLFNRQYETAKHILDDLLSEEGVKNREYNNIIAFCGDRGSGKSSCMKSFIEQKKAEAGNNFIYIETIDPSFFDESHNILELVLGQLYQLVCKYDLKVDATEAEKTLYQDERSKLLLKFDSIMRDLKFLAKAEDRERFYDCLQELDALSVGVNLQRGIADLMAASLKFLNDSPLLVISIDDLDLNIKGAYTMSEHIRKYLTNDKCIILIGVKIDQLIESITINLSNEVKVSKEEAFRMAVKYVSKLIPMASRVNMPMLDDYRNLELDYKISDNNVTSFHSVQEAVTHQIFWKTGYLFYNSKGKSSFIVPRNLRSLRQLLHLLASMPTHQKEKKVEHHANQSVFKDYFWNTWTQQLNDKYREIVSSLVDAVEYQTFNKRILDVLSSVGSNNLEKAPNNQYAYNITMGDVFAEIIRLENTETESQIQLLLFFIKTLCSMRIYEAYDDVTESAVDAPNPEEDVRNGEIYTTDALFKSTNNIQRIINGRYFSYLSNDVLPYKGKAENHRDLLLIDGEQLSIELKRIGGIEGDLSAEDKQKFNTLEFIILCASRHAIMKRKSDDFGVIPVTSQPLYISSFNYGTKNIVFDVLAPFFNIINLEMTYNRFNDAFQLGNANSPKLYDYVKEKEWTLGYKLVNANIRDYEKPELSLLSDAVIRNGEVLTAITERIRSVRNHKYSSTENNKVLKDFYGLIADTDMKTYPRVPKSEPYNISFHFLNNICEVLENCDTNYLDRIYSKQEEVEERQLELVEIFTQRTYRQSTIISKLKKYRLDIYQQNSYQGWRQLFHDGIDIPKDEVIATIRENLQVVG